MEIRGPRGARRDERERELIQLARLERQIHDQRRKIAELERVRDTMMRLPSGSISYEGICAECGVGVIVRDHDSLRCTSCRFQCHL